MECHDNHHLHEQLTSFYVVYLFCQGAMKVYSISFEQNPQSQSTQVTNVKTQKKTIPPEETQCKCPANEISPLKSWHTLKKAHTEASLRQTPSHSRPSQRRGCRSSRTVSVSRTIVHCARPRSAQCVTRARTPALTTGATAVPGLNV